MRFAMLLREVIILPVTATTSKLEIRAKEIVSQFFDILIFIAKVELIE
jgi:hypothetical protein